MAIPFFDEIQKLITEHGSAAALRERVALAKERAEALERRNDELEQENRTLKATLQSLVRKAEPAKADLELFRRYAAHFQPDGHVLDFLRTHDMAVPFHEENIEPIRDYLNRWRGPNYEFLDENLEDVRKEFDEHLKEFFEELSAETFPSHRKSHFTMDFMDAEVRPEKWEAQKKLNSLSASTAAAYDEFFRLGQRTFPNEKFA